MKDKKQQKLEQRRKVLDKMLAKMEEKKVKDLAQSIEDLSYFLTRKIDKKELKKK